MKYCSQCGTELPDDATFCAECGAPQTQEEPSYAPSEPEVPAPKKSRVGLIAGILALVVLIVAALYFWPRVSTGPSNPSGQSEAAAPVLPAGEIAPEEDIEEPADIFQSLDDLSAEEKAAYLKGLLERTEAQLEEELAKGTAADQSLVQELQESVSSLRESLDRITP